MNIPSSVSQAARLANQSIKKTHEATHGQGDANPSATSRVANPALRSDAGLGVWKPPTCKFIMEDISCGVCVKNVLF